MCLVDRLQSLPFTAFPTDYPRGPPAGCRITPSVQTLDLPTRTCTALRLLADSNTGMFDVLFAAFCCILHRHTGDDDLVVVSATDGTPHPLIIRFSLNSEDRFGDVVQKLQDAQQLAGSDCSSLAALLSALGLQWPPFHVGFFNSDFELPNLNGLSNDIDLFLSVSEGGVTFQIVYDSSLFMPDRIFFLVDQLSFFIDQVASNRAESPIASISLLTDSQRTVIPDPRADLDWCGWKGAITDIFTQNAKQHPTKRCVIQTFPPQDPHSHPVQVIYTYEMIRKASNVLAHHLLLKGIQREDIVMVYAHRSAELMIAAMAILKAGATFSVLDPAYPPDRQIMYLRVGRPKGLITIKDAGVIDPAVREYLKSDLSIVVEVPALQVLPSGHLIGGSLRPDEPDVLEHQHYLGDFDPNIPLGPDSIGTLSFTSGSTGIPKGVKGRHHSLTFFFPWMGKTFEITENATFTMLSGIAHDPIQRDIFTPLFFGAELHIPTADDIGTPGQLAQWMLDSGITTTHLTPAMSQVLAAQASIELPALTNAFITGDMLQKRDCLRIQSLCPNARIINMYVLTPPSTETSRAVSYFAIPPSSQSQTLDKHKDIIPAGVGMEGLQLLVVNRTDKNVLCGVGEVGEIYLRSGALSEGYLDPRPTEEKFWQNWFLPEGAVWPDTIVHPCWKGVRDRMYRSGDMGRYLADGTVECSGRADNQVKIRGFRVELGEIDTILSQHHAVRENATILKTVEREKILVSYFVPADLKILDEGNVERRRTTLKDVRAHLKNKLASYSVPTFVIPLNRMPLNPNGKIDKPALPFPPPKDHDGSEDIATPTETALRQIWSKILPSSPNASSIGLQESFFDRGGHSILATQLVFQIRQTFQVNTPISLVFHHPTLKELSTKIDSLRHDIPHGIGHSSPTTISDYCQDYHELAKRLPSSYPHLPYDFATRNSLTVFLTGATGFLGAYVLRDLLDLPETNRISKVICLVRDDDQASAIARLRETATNRGVWQESWLRDGKVEVVIGDLSHNHLGLGIGAWERVANEVDIIVHNGALVHWVYSYAKLRSSNVLSTLATMRLASTNKQKLLVFLSSTSVLDTPEYVSSSKTKPIQETDDLGQARNGLVTGYSQTKWVCEKLLMEAGRRGLAGHIIRACYVVGESTTGVSNTDDFIWRMVKGCIEIGHAPRTGDSLNMVPVDQVARITSSAALTVPTAMNVYQLTAPHLPSFDSIHQLLAEYGFQIQICEYTEWKEKLEEHVTEGKETALYPLLHMVLDDLPDKLQAPRLSSTNVQQLLGETATRLSVTDDVLEVYFSWMVRVGFLAQPDTGLATKTLPELGSELISRATGRRRL